MAATISSTTSATLPAPVSRAVSAPGLPPPGVALGWLLSIPIGFLLALLATLIAGAR